jgi:hypothetical protein
MVRRWVVPDSICFDLKQTHTKRGAHIRLNECFPLRNWKQEDALMAKYEHHTEFVLGLDFNLFVDGLIATCSWDRYQFEH